MPLNSKATPGLHNPMELTISPARPIALFGIATTLLAGGALVGASMNAINAIVSPLYFRMTLQWHEVEGLWRAAVAQGIFEGLLYGSVLSLIFTLVVGLTSKARCSYRFALRPIVGMLIGIYCCWALGGLIAMALASLSPEFYRNAFVGVPAESGAMLRYAWVGGSIWGALFGSCLAIVFGSILFAAAWPRRHPNTTTQQDLTAKPHREARP